MSVSSLSDLAHKQMLSILGYSSSGSSQSNSSSSNSTSSSSSLSPFAQMLAELQQMEESNPGQYAKVSQQISTKLSTAASTAKSGGNTALASQLTTLSIDFSTAAQTGQLPNIGDLESVMHFAGSSAAAAPGGAAKTGAHSGVMNTIHQVLSLAGI